MNLSIVIVSWNKKELLKKCLESVFDLTPSPQSSPIKGEEGQKNPSPLVGEGKGEGFEVFVVDNGSQDGTSEMVRKDFPQARLIVNEKNLGFAKANNQALEQIIKLGAAPRDQVSPVETRSLPAALPDFILLLNQDMEVLPGTLAGMVDFMRAHPEAGAAGCHLINKKGETVPQARRCPTLLDQAAIILKLPHIFPNILDLYLMKNFDYSKSAEVDLSAVLFLLFAREILEKLGGLDERFFFWFEEVDFCQQVKRAGWKIMYNSSVKCVDLVGQSVKELSPYKKQKMFLDSMLKILEMETEVAVGDSCYFKASGIRNGMGRGSC